MLDFYLNHQFDLSKIMIFCKFYTKHFEDKIVHELSKLINKDTGSLSEQQIFDLKERVFGQHDGLVDMQALSKFLVKKTGRSQIIDPTTREDSLWKMIDMFT